MSDRTAGQRPPRPALRGTQHRKGSGDDVEKVQLVLRYLLYFLLAGSLIDMGLFALFVWTGNLVLATLPFSHLVLEGISYILIRMVRSTFN